MVFEKTMFLYKQDRPGPLPGDSETQRVEGARVFDVSHPFLLVPRPQALDSLEPSGHPDGHPPNDAPVWTIRSDENQVLRSSDQLSWEPDPI